MAAEISPCGVYRYSLSRPGDPPMPRGTPPAVFLMLNPSTADAELDDPTIRRCRGFAQRWGKAGIVVVNLYALRATDPRALQSHPDPVGPANGLRLSSIAMCYKDVVCAWGKHADPARARDVANMMLDNGVRLWCLGTNKDGSPKHPLYLSGATELVPWSIP